MLHMGDQSADEYFSKIDSFVTLLSDLGSDVSEDDVVTYAINGLSDKYGSLAQIIAHKDPFPDLATMRSMVSTEEMRLRSKSPIQPTNMTVSAPQVLLVASNIPRGGDNHNTRNRDNHKPNTSTEAQHAFSPQQQALFASTVQGSGIASQPNAYGQETYLLQALNTMTLQEPADLNWNMVHHLTLTLPQVILALFLILAFRQFVSDNKCTIKFDEFGFSVKDFETRQILLQGDSTGDLYPVTSPSYPKAFLLGKHVRLPFSLYETVVTSAFDIIHSDLWTSLLSSVSGIKYYVLFLDHFSHYLWVPCLVANGSSQLASIDVDEPFSPVVKPATIRTVLSLAISRHWPVHQLDVKNAFLNGYLSETVYMQQPPGFRDSQHPDYGTDIAYLLLYVDDIVLTTSSTTLLQRIITYLHAEFSMTDLGPLNYFLGVFVTRDTSGMFLAQQKYATEVLEHAGMLTCNPCRTPVDTDSKLSADGDPVFDPTLYRSLSGALQYLTFTRPDISYAVQQVCLFIHDPREPYFSALKRILRYVRGTLSYGLQLYSSTTSTLVAYSYADWAGCPTTPEYRGVANVVAETCWMRNLLRELHTQLSTATLVYCDNVSAVYLSSNPVQHQRTKHIEIDIHFVRDLVSTGRIRVLHVPSHYQCANIFTKGLPTALFDEFRSSLSVRSSPAQTTG
nr:hypothetical protein [Tanacetum cinerariifolium]